MCFSSDWLLVDQCPLSLIEGNNYTSKLIVSEVKLIDIPCAYIMFCCCYFSFHVYNKVHNALRKIGLMSSRRLLKL